MEAAAPQLQQQQGDLGPFAFRYEASDEGGADSDSDDGDGGEVGLASDDLWGMTLEEKRAAKRARGEQEEEEDSSSSEESDLEGFDEQQMVPDILDSDEAKKTGEICYDGSVVCTSSTALRFGNDRPLSYPSFRTLVFHNEVLDSLQRGVSQDLNPENLVVEINSSRHAYNETW